MGVRANWFLDEVPAALDAPDPFECVEPEFGPVRSPEERIEDVGTPIDLRNPDAAIAHLPELIEEEARLYDAGITCPIRDRNDTACSACSFCHENEEGHRLQPLCKVGRETERALTLHAHLIEQRRAQ